MKIIIEKNISKEKTSVDGVERYIVSEDNYEIYVHYEDGHKETYSMAECWIYPDPEKYPKEMVIRDRKYMQQYQTDDGMYYHTDEEIIGEAEKYMFQSFVQLHNDGRLTYLFNGHESVFANYDYESGEIKYK